MTDEADRTIFDSSELNSAEKVAIQKGEARGKKAAMAEDPERFGMAGAKGRGRKQFEKNYEKIVWK